MTAAIIGCGDSAEKWWYNPILCNNGAIRSYGVNDAYKWGFPFSNVIVINGPNQFTPDRLQHISGAVCHSFLTNLPSAWSRYGVKNPIAIRITPFLGRRLHKTSIVHSKTSPFVAMSMAYNDGFDDIALFGVDFNNHKIYRTGTKDGNYEIKQYAKFAELAAKEGVKIRVTKESALSKFIDTF